MVFLIQPRVVPADVKFLPSNMPLKTAYITTVNVHLMCTYCEVSVKKILADKKNQCSSWAQNNSKLTLASGTC